MNRSLIVAILISGFIVGTADIILAFINTYIQSGTRPELVLRYIASGVFDKKAFTPATSPMIVWGLLLHYLVAYIFTIIFFLLYPRVNWMSHNKILTGILYGIFVWAVMHFIVLPYSLVPGKHQFVFEKALLPIAILVVAIGLPLSFLAYRFYYRKRKLG